MDKKQGMGIALGVAALAFGIHNTREPSSNPDDIILTDLQISPSEVEVGDAVIISCLAYNEGENKATRNVTLEVT